MIIQPSSKPAFDKIIKLPVQSSSIKRVHPNYETMNKIKKNHVDDETQQEELKIELS